MENYCSSSVTRRKASMGILALQICTVFVQLVALTCAASSFEKDLTLTLNQKLALDKFKQRVEGKLPHEYMRQDIYLIRWLRARNFNIEQADQMLSESLKWRKSNKIDTILQEDWSEFQEKYQFTLDTVARDGKPILTANFGEWDIRAISVAGRMPQLIRYLYRGLEDVTSYIRKMEEQGKNVTQFEFFVNMDNYNVIQHGCLQCVSFYLALVNSYENYYPGFADHIVLLNTPRVFEVVLRLLRPLMSPITRQSVKVFGQDKAAWSKWLYAIVEKNQLAPEYGGTYKRQKE